MNLPECLTGKGINWGVFNQPEFTGYGNVYFAQNMLELKGDSFKDKTVVISGSGNAAHNICEKSSLNLKSSNSFRFFWLCV